MMNLNDSLLDNQVAEMYAFLPREAVTRFLMSCSDCQKRMHLQYNSSPTSSCTGLPPSQASPLPPTYLSSKTISSKKIITNRSKPIRATNHISDINNPKLASNEEDEEYDLIIEAGDDENEDDEDKEGVLLVDDRSDETGVYERPSVARGSKKNGSKSKAHKSVPNHITANGVTPLKRGNMGLQKVVKNVKRQKQDCREGKLVNLVTTIFIPPLQAYFLYCICQESFLSSLNE